MYDDARNFSQAYALKAGDKALITKRGEDFDMHGMGRFQEWQNCWCNDMDRFIGTIATVSRVTELGVFFKEHLEEEERERLVGNGLVPYAYGYPLNVLEKVA